VECVEARERNELELVPHRSELALELRDRVIVEVTLPVERRRAVVGEALARELAVDRFRELTSELEVGFAGLNPQQIGVRCECETASDGCRWSRVRAIEPFRGAVSREERLVAVVDVTRDEV